MMLKPLEILLIWTMSQASVSGPAVAPDPIPARLVPTVEASVDRNTVQIGDPINLTVKITYDQSVTIVTNPRGVNLGGFEILDSLPGSSTTEPNGVVTKTDTYRIATFETGDDLEIPPIRLEYKTDDGRTGSLQTQPIQITMNRLIPEEEAKEKENLELRDIKPVQSVLGNSYLWVVWTVLAVLLVVGLLAYWLYRRYASGPKEEKLPPPIPPHEMALQLLDNLRNNRELIEGKEYKQFSIAVSEIIRHYLLNRYHIDAMDETSYETLQQIKRLQLGYEINKQFESFFEHCDLMKFARHEPDDTIFLELIEKGVTIVNSTKQTLNTDGERSV